MTIFIYVCVGMLIVVAIILGAVFISARKDIKSTERKTIELLKTFSLDELEKKVFMYDSVYFRIIGEENESVIEFRKIIENKDISALYKKWGGFEKSFRKLERKVGHQGRPLLIDSYFQYDLAIKELYERKKAEL